MMTDQQITTMQPLNPLDLPLDQNALIEASAGTGKTYTITTLYLRALLGLVKGTQGNTLSPKSIDEILVVTFTEAATQEIKDRVRAKLQEAQSALIAGSADDANTQALLAEFTACYLNQQPQKTESEARLYAYHRLQDAITLIDEASIFTIHGFCHRCLQQFAFETNSSFEQTFEMDAKPTLLGALQDFWRRNVASLNGAEFEWFAHFWRDPDSLYQAIAEVIGKRVHIKPLVQPEQYRDLLTQHTALINQLKSLWPSSNFSSAVSQSGIKKTSKTFKQLGKLGEFMQSDASIMAFAKGDGWHLWSSDTLCNAANFSKNSEPFSHPLLALIDQLSEVENKLRNGYLQSYWLNQTKVYMEQRAAQLKTESQIINPDDLLTELLRAIETDQEGNLVKAIQSKYPLAFIDEFQDTDPVQYGIFSAVYKQVEIEEEAVEEIAQQDSSSSVANMILIGDPKQAIYKFRGADIFTYIQAKQDIASSQHYTLGKNYRSHPNLIKAVNQCFTLGQDSFQHKQIPFIQVGAGKEFKQTLTLRDAECSNLDLWHLLPEPAPDTAKPKTGFSKGEAEALFAKWCANDVFKQLQQAREKALCIAGKPVKPQDICVLVRNRQQASLVKKALAELQVPAVFISRDNVFRTELAKDLLRVLLALETPFNELKVRSACATSIFTSQVQDLMELNADSNSWQQRLDLFVQANELWSKGKVAPALKVLTDSADTFTRWRRELASDASRQITDFRHLVELIQQQAVRKAGSQKLLLWYEQQVLATDNWSDASEEQQLRLESDSDLVQIATLHASKGLEYPIVYLPFITEYKAAQKAIYHSNSDSAPGLSYKVDNGGIEMQIAEQERLAEDLRLLYVAMTRPIYKLVMGIVNIQAPRSAKSEVSQTALGHLLFSEQIAAELPIENEFIGQACQLLIHQANEDGRPGSIAYLDKTSDQVFAEHKSNKQMASEAAISQREEHLAFSEFAGDVTHPWRMLSYSALAASHHAEQDIWLPGVSDEGNDFAQAVAEVNPDLELVKTAFTFPKGANAGSCLHWILENLDFTLPVQEQREAVEQGLERYGISLDWAEVCLQWMQSILDSHIDKIAPKFGLNQLTEANKLVEMEFYFSFARLTPQVLKNALLMAGIDNNQVNLTIFEDQRELAGIVKGFIDLTFEHQGVFYVLDYKSNHLGHKLTDYTEERMQEAMSEHNYQLQALIYTLALHRFLQQRIKDYDYDRHVGGAVYLFLRGMAEDGGEDVENKGVYHLIFKRAVIEYLDNALLNSDALPEQGKRQKEQQTQAQAAENNRVDSALNKPEQSTAVKANNNQMGFDFD